MRKFHSFRAVALACGAVFVVACGSGSSNDERMANLEKQLAETQKQLAESKAEAPAGTTEQVAPAPTEQPPAAAPAQAAPAAGTKPSSGAKPSNAPAKPTSPPASQQYATADQVAKNRADAERLVAQQRDVNARQADTNQKVQGQIEAMKPREVTLAPGTTIAVRTTSELSTNMSTGAGFDATLESDLKSGGVVVAPAKSRVTGYIVNADKGGRVKGTASLVVALRSIVGVKGTVINVTTDQYTADAQSTKGKDVKRTGIATGVGAVIGGIAGGGSGAAAGAGIGAAAGVGTAMATRGAAAVIPAEELLEFHLASPVTVVIQP